MDHPPTSPSRICALATDYDGTIAHHGVVPESTFAALARWREAGRTLIMATGRELEELKTVCPRLDLFHLVVAENGALLWWPADGRMELLSPAPDPAFVARLRERGVGPISVGHTIIATWEPHEQTVLDVIKEMGLELHVIFNKGAVMILPTGVNKATGVKAALERLGLRPEETAAVGDAENDHAFLDLCGLPAAVANAVPALKERARIVLGGDHGAGVEELIGHLLGNAAPAPR